MTVTLRELRRFDGPNVWARAPVTRLLIEIDASRAAAPEEAGRLATRLTALVPRLVATSAEDAPLPPVPFDPEAGVPALLAATALNLQRLARIDVSFHAARWNEGASAHEIAVEHRDGAIGEAAARFAMRLLDPLLRDPENEIVWLADAIVRFRARAATFRPDTAERVIRQTAQSRGIPVSRLDPSGRFVELGTGAYRRRIQGSITSRTPAITAAIVLDKAVTHHYLRAAGLPVPDAGVARTAEQAVRIAHEIGFPVVVKPVDSGAMAGVSLDLRDDEAVRASVPRAIAASPSGRVLVERFVSGDKYRVTVVDGRLVHASQRTRAGVTGDGVSTIRQLVEIENRNPLRGPLESDPFFPIVLDDAVVAYLGEQGLDLDGVPEAGQAVALRCFPHIRNGGLAIDRTAQVHPENVAIFVQATRAVEADVATLDVIATDITRPMRSAGGAIIELNLGSGFRLELAMPGGPLGNPGPPIVDMLFPPGTPVRAPLIAICGEAESGAGVARTIAAIAGAAGITVSSASADGVQIAGARVRYGDGRDAAGARLLLNNPATELAVVQVDAASLVEEGLGFEYCDVAVVLGLSGLRTPDGRAVERVVTDLVGVGGALVLNADDAAVRALADETGGTVIPIASGSVTPFLRAHLAGGGRAVVAEAGSDGQTIVLRSGEERTEIGRIARETADSLPLLAAMAVAIARGIRVEDRELTADG